MKKFLLIPLIMAALTLPGFAKENATQQPKVETIEAPGQPKFMDDILNGYNDGKYRTFLKRMHENYTDANQKWEYNNLLEERKKLSTIVQDFDSPKSDAFKKKMASLHEAENRELVELCLSESHCPLTRDVKDMVFFTPTQQQQESLKFLSTLSWKFKGDGKTPLENKLIDIDTEFWLKSLALETLVAQNRMDVQTFKEQRAVLGLEKLKQMQLACQGKDVDPQVKQSIETALQIYPKVQTSSMTRKHLHDLAIGKVLPQSDAEEKIQQIVAKYHTKQQELLKEYFPED